MDESTLRHRLLLALPLAVALVVAACGATGREAADADPDPEYARADSAAADSSDTARAGSPESDPTDGSAATSATTTTAPSATRTSHTMPTHTPVTYDGDFGASVAPILAEKCASCHAPGGPGTARWTLASAGDVVDELDSLVEVIDAGDMPPWPAGGASPAFVGDRSLRSDQLAAIRSWVADGAPLDVDRSTPIEPVAGLVGLADPDRVIAPAQAYAGSTATRDDYRCQIYDPGLPDGGWITGYEFRPDQSEVVHHAIGYLIPADRRARAEARDGEDGRPGWSCYGSSGLGRDEIFLGWAPGQNPTELPDGTGLWVEPGAFLVVQIHYHYEDSAPADRSSLALRAHPAGSDELTPVRVASLVGPAEIPCSSFESGPLCDRQAAAAAARQRYGIEGVQADFILKLCQAEVDDFAGMTDGEASSSCDLPAGLVGADGQVLSVLGHEHELGDWFRLTLNPGQADERVLLDIPDWDFDWQYNYVPVDDIIIEPDDVLRIECGWDRSRRDPTLEPAYVLWADGTDDEMCFATISTRPVG